MRDHAPRIGTAMVGVIALFCRAAAPLGVAGLTVWDLTMLGMGGNPWAAPLHGLAIALIVIIVCVALADHNRRHNDARFDALEDVFERRLVAVATEPPTVPLPHAVVGLVRVVPRAESPGHADSYAAGQMARLGEALELAERDRDIQIAALHDKIEAVTVDADRKLQSSVQWLTKRFGFGDT